MAVWRRSVSAEDRLDLAGKLEYRQGQPYFRGRLNGEEHVLPIIYRDSPVIGGVCVGADRREAFFVSPTSISLRGLYHTAKDKAPRHGNQNRAMLKAITDVVGSEMPYNAAGVDRIVLKYGVKDDGLISLGEFIRGRAGVCRHQAVAWAALAEMFIKTNLLNGGRANVHRNESYEGAHTWGVYTTPNGFHVVGDVARNFLGILEDERVQRAISEGKLWDYNRPDNELMHDD